MVGVGSSSALNAFNIGQGSGQGTTAIGMAIRDIVAQGDKLALTQGGQDGALAAGIGTAQFKNQLEENQRGDIYGVGPDGQPALLGGAVKTNRDKFINLKPEDFSTDPVSVNERRPVFGTPEREEQFYKENPQNVNNPNLTPGSDINVRPPNIPEEVWNAASDAQKAEYFSTLKGI